MAALPPVTQLAGSHGPLFEAYWSQLDTSRSGRIDAVTAAAFLKKSQMGEPVLHKIWSLSDPNGTGYLDKQGFFLALRLVAACQNGKDPSVSTITLADPPPRLMGVEAQSVSKWKVEPEERKKFDRAFQNLMPVNGLLSGDKVKNVMLASKLPVEVLVKIWSLSDIDRDGSLDVDEFAVAMQLIKVCQSGDTPPAVLPTSLVPPAKVAKVTSLIPSPGAVHSSQPVPSPLATRKTVPMATDWVVTPEIKVKYDGYFEGIDKDHDGIVTGDEARQLLMSSNLPQQILAHIWQLCDVENSGKLNAEQFALAMFLIAEKVRGKDPPKELAPNMVPPSMRKKQVPRSATPTSTISTPPLSNTPPPPPSIATTSAVSTSSAATPTQSGFANDFSAIRELDSIGKEIETIHSEKTRIQEEIQQTRDAVQERKEEIATLQTDVQKFTEQKEQLQRQKEEAQTELDKLEQEKAKFVGQIAELKQKCKDEEEEVERLKSQMTQQESSKRSQAEELQKLTEQLENLRKEEMEYKQKVDVSAAEFEKLQKANQNLQQEVTQARQKVDALKAEHQSLSHALTLYPPVSTPGSTPSSSVININDVGQLSAEVTTPHLSEPDAISARATAGSSSPVSSISGFSTNSHLEETGGDQENKDTKPDPFAATTSTAASDPFAAFSVATTDPFASTGVFSGKPSDLSAFDPFGSADLFKDPFYSTSGPTTPPAPPTSSADPFSGQDPFVSDVFGKHTNQSSWTTGPSAFGADPFSTSTHTPTTSDPFTSTDPFADDSLDLFTGSQSSSNPFSFSNQFVQPSQTNQLPTSSSTASDSQQLAWEGSGRGEAVQHQQREKANQDSLLTS